MRDALFIVDVFQDFEHEDGEALLRSFRARQPALRRALEDARAGGVPVTTPTTATAFGTGTPRGSSGRQSPPTRAPPQTRASSSSLEYAEKVVGAFVERAG